MFVQQAAPNLHAEEQKPDERIARRATEDRLGAKFEGAGACIILAAVSGSERRVDEWRFHEEKRSLSLSVARAELLRRPALYNPHRGGPPKAFELQKVRSKPPEFVNSLAPRKHRDPPGKPETADNHQGCAWQPSEK
jgi:hypothetical protein